ncbi:uncharacterized protein BO66DRAFT_143775 [Aspergillus aculeatinus CBS 121060]|uniref:Uncharacterized protein n=1 Tax=Aspergillus aculeatinus CBS 121060 TaxID=1448322 RepID=A0ACD1HJY5_9EURO|nr:hypothetical protein BO66DRAFT_143775 [Aspergillus aculeatinus CBS 121060]RAH74169.1 hypothetical protein BO66DRAFT_143775 [Aspergillus aculeatinus CBS 121060]
MSGRRSVGQVIRYHLDLDRQTSGNTYKMKPRILGVRSTGLSSSSMDGMIIGVVLGSVVLVAVTGILAFLCHKRRSMQRREDRQFLIDHHISYALGYYPTLRDLDANQKEQQLEEGRGEAGGGTTMSSVFPPPAQPMSRLSAHYHSPVDDFLRDPPPAYQPQPLPTYDPSRYQRVDAPPPPAPAVGLAIPYHHYPTLGLQQERPPSSILSPPAPIMAQRDSLITPRFSFQPSPTIGPLRDLNDDASLASSNNLDGTAQQMPRRPRPVLSRLVTDLR